jgi:hypothetical protein
MIYGVRNHLGNSALLGIPRYVSGIRSVMEEENR